MPLSVTGAADDPDLSIALTRSMATLSSPDLYILSVELVISLRLLVIPVFCYGAGWLCDHCSDVTVAVTSPLSHWRCEILWELVSLRIRNFYKLVPISVNHQHTRVFQTSQVSKNFSNSCASVIIFSFFNNIVLALKRSKSARFFKILNNFQVTAFTILYFLYTSTTPFTAVCHAKVWYIDIQS